VTSAALAPDAVVELCAFQVGDEEYLIDIHRIREILQLVPITPVPAAPPFVEGVADLRGEVIPVVDVRKRLGLEPRGGVGGKLLVVNVGGQMLGLLVDAVVEVVRTTRSRIGPPPALVTGGARLFLGVCGAGKGTRAPATDPQRAAPASRGAAPAKLRLLLNVKALLTPGPLMASPGDAPEGTKPP